MTFSSNLVYTINSVYVHILSVHLEVISSEQLHLYTSNASEYCVGLTTRQPTPWDSHMHAYHLKA